MPVKVAAVLFSSLLCIIIAFSAGYKVKGWKDKSALQDQISASILAQNKQNSENNKVAVSYSKKKESYDEKQKEPVDRMVRETIAAPVYSECRLTPAGLLNINSAIDTANTLISSG